MAQGQGSASEAGEAMSFLSPELGFQTDGGSPDRIIEALERAEAELASLRSEPRYTWPEIQARVRRVLDEYDEAIQATEEGWRVNRGR